MGNETSFRSFPAHVHNLLTVLLAETHVVHTKIYPRYRSKRNISFSRDDFGKWLEPHEDVKTDVVLLGHSMGGLLSAEVVLMPPPPPGGRALKHRILGTINFDVPFLGMHPGVVMSGLASIFKPADGPIDTALSPEMQPSDGAMSPLSPASSLGRNDTLWTPDRPDPNFNPSFNNDVVLPMRKGWQNVAHFVNKHSDHLFKSTKQLVTSHLEFGGAMANYSELKTRYGRIRALEVEDENVRQSVTRDSTTAPPRVRFVNYYTASTGRPKKPKSPTASLSPSADQTPNTLSPEAALEEPSRGRSQHGATCATQSIHSRSTSPRISLEEHSDKGIVHKEPEIPSSGDEGWEEAAETLTIDHPLRSNTTESEATMTADANTDSDSILSPVSTISTTASLPPIPDLPSAPPPLDTSYIQDADTRKLVGKEHARAVKSYEKAVKDREKAIRDRKKLEEKRERKTQKDAERAAKDALKAKQKAELDARKAERKQVEAEKKSQGTEKEVGKEMTQQQQEELRLAKERQRMEAEGRRMRGEKEPDEEQQKELGGKEEPAEEEQEELEKTSAPMEESEFISVDQAPALQQLSSASASASASERSRSPSPNPSTQDQERQPKAPKVPKDRKFCTLPPKDANGQRDPCWVRVFMENMDEVGAHCGLFFVDERYERLVGEVAERVEGWVREDEGERVVREMEMGLDVD